MVDNFPGLVEWEEKLNTSKCESIGQGDSKMVIQICFLSASFNVTLSWLESGLVSNSSLQTTITSSNGRVTSNIFLRDV